MTRERVRTDAHSAALDRPDDVIQADRGCRRPRTHLVRQFHGCYSLGDDQLWGVTRPQHGSNAPVLATVNAEDWPGSGEGPNAVHRSSGRRPAAGWAPPSPDTADRLRKEVDELVCLETPERFFGVGQLTLLFDLLTPHEELRRANVFDIELLAGRLGEVTDWVRHQPGCAGHPVCYFGASTGAAAALWAAAAPGADVVAVVSRGGRPDLAAPRLGEVHAPTLLIVGGHDTVVLDLNRRAQALMRCETRILVIPGATHLFEEPGTLELAAADACAWFTDHIVPVPRPTS